MLMSVRLCVWLFVLLGSCARRYSSITLQDNGNDLALSSLEAIEAVLEEAAPTCSLVLLTDGTTPSAPLAQILKRRRNGAAILEIVDTNSRPPSNDSHRIPSGVTIARTVRKNSWCSVVVVVSESPTFLARVAEWSLKGRLLVWSTKMLVVTRLALHHLLSLLPSHWTFSMMNTVVLNLEHPRPNTRCVAYSWEPYSATGARLVPVASWTPTRGLRLRYHYTLFQHKFTNFHGSTINITARPFMPFFGVETKAGPDGTPVTRYMGADYQLLATVAAALNFTFTVLPTDSWPEVIQLVEERVSFLCPNYHILMSVRMEKYDFTFFYEFAYFSFTLAAPGIGAQWQSLYRPLAAQVWLAVLGSLMLLPILMYWIKSVRQQEYGGSVGVVVQDMTGLLLGQNLPPHLPRVNSTRILVAFWLIYALILGASYRGNLTAALTIPIYPPRPETLNQLVQSVDKITIASYGRPFKQFYQQSSSELFQALAALMEVDIPPKEGIQETLEKKQSHLGGRRFLQQSILRDYTEVDGSNPLYVGRESIFPAPSGWPIPHDAPYQDQLNRWIVASLEAGLYEKWISDMLRQTTLETLRRLKQQQQEEDRGEMSPGDTGGEVGIKSLTITQLQGLFMLLLLGLLIATYVFIGEHVMARCVP